MTGNCKNCGTALAGKYCFQCGQKKIELSDRKFRHLVIEFFHHLTHLDSKFHKTLKNIFVNPGKVTRDISKGITVPHFKLSTLFLIGTVTYFLLPNSFIVSTSLNSNFKTQLEQSEFRQLKSNILEKKMRTTNMSMDALATRYDQRQHTFGKLLTLILIPLLIPFLWIINLMIKLFKREHEITTYDLGVASLEINSIFLYGVFLLCGFLIKFVGLITHNETAIAVCFGVMLAAVFGLLFLFFKRSYHINWWQSLISLALLIFGYVQIISIYSLVAFLLFI